MQEPRAAASRSVDEKDAPVPPNAADFDVRNATPVESCTSSQSPPPTSRMRIIRVACTGAARPFERIGRAGNVSGMIGRTESGRNGPFARVDSPLPRMDGRA
jgi:hypothetical protein